MERYEAILEQLKAAQSRGMETVTNRLDFVVQSLEELIQEAKTTVQGALPKSADECLPVDEVMAAFEAYRDQAEAERLRAADLEAKLGGMAVVADNVPNRVSIELMRSLDGARSQSELLKELLPAISDHAARAVVLVLREGKVSAWSGIGFADGEALRSWQGDLSESAALVRLIEVSQPVRFTPEKDSLFSDWLAREDTPEEILLIPVVLRGKLMGTVYIDQLEGQPWNPETAQTLVAQVCWLIDTLQYRTAAAPTLAEPVAIGEIIDATKPEKQQKEEEPPAEEKTASEGEPESTGEEAAEEVEVDVDAWEKDTTRDAEPEGDEPGESAQGVMDADPSATMRVDVSRMDYADIPPKDEDGDVTDAAATIVPEAEIEEEISEPGAPVEAAPESETVGETFEPEAYEEPPPKEAGEPEQPMEAESVSQEPVDAPPPVQMPVEPPGPEEEDEEPESSQSQFLDEPPPVQPVQPPPEEPEQEVSEDEAHREEARRFARLLVSEIKLYNEEQVERGRESNDIYNRLREDIDRSREMFDKRISAEVRANQDYFTDELVRILADGDPDMLGM